MSNAGSSKQQPESLAKFAKTAKNKSGKPVRDGTEAKEDTSPVSTDPALEHVAATKVLREGVYHKDEGADEAIDKLPDRVSKDT